MSTYPSTNAPQTAAPGPARGHSRPTLGIVIRFKDSMRTLPQVIEAVRRQTVQPDLIVGVDNNSTDGSTDFMKSIGAQIVPWARRYSHPLVMNAGVGACKTDLVMGLSSHMLMLADDTIQRLVEAMQDEQTASASLRQNRYYSECVDWNEMQSKGLVLGSLYSNSLGVLRRKFWEEHPFEERLTWAEDFEWVLEQMRRGRKARRLDLAFRTERQGAERLLGLTRDTFILGKHFGLPVYWLGIKGTIRQVCKGTFKCVLSLGRDKEARKLLYMTRLEVWGALTWRWHDNLNR